MGLLDVTKMTSSGHPRHFSWFVFICIGITISSTQQLEDVPMDDEYRIRNESYDGKLMHTDGLDGDGGHMRAKRILVKEGHWPKGVIPYKFIEVDDKNGRDITAAMATYEYFTPLRFVKWSPDLYKRIGHKSYIKFKTTYERGWSLVGFANGNNGQWLDCPHLLTCLHEIGHALGFEHEQYHPERDKWIRINKKKLREYDTYVRLGWNNFADYSQFDLSTVMLYRSAYGNYDILFKEIPFEYRHFYYLKELCQGYKCDEYPQCHNHKLNCENGGYVSVVENKCACICPTNLDPATQCRDVVKSGPSQWPVGRFSLLEHKDGCPRGSFRTGLWRHYATDESIINSNDFKGDASNNKLELSFCTKTRDTGSKHMWPVGNYCFLKYGSCPNQKGFYEAVVDISGRADTSKNVFYGYLPSGKKGQDASLEFCCTRSGFTYIPANFPSDKSFILFAFDDEDCQAIAGMHVKMEKFAIGGGQTKSLLRHTSHSRQLNVNYCVYTPRDRDCGAVVTLSSSRRSFTLESDRRNPSLKECNWLFKSHENGTFVFSLDEFNGVSGNTECVDKVEVQPTMIAQKGVQICKYEKESIQSLFGEMRVAYTSGPNSNTYFRATIKFIPDSDLCYSTKDSGWSYRGKVNYTRAFEPCLPWIETTSCRYNPYNPKHILDGLEGNYCRNPDGAFRPWCYTKLEGCERNYCDVCQLEKSFDNATDCDLIKKQGLCSENLVQCAATCDIKQYASISLVSRVKCNRPGSISGGSVNGATQQQYDVGDKVTYTCRMSRNLVERTCLTTGHWSDANTACLPCPQGYRFYGGNCYIYHKEHVRWEVAKAECEKNGDFLVMPKTIEENQFLDSMKYYLNPAWIGLTLKNEVHTWVDGTKVDWTNWKYSDVPHPKTCTYLRVDTKWRSSPCLWDYNFVCQRTATANLDCKDFINNCPNLVSSLNSSNCDLSPGLDAYCRYSCGNCPTDCNRVTTFGGWYRDDIFSVDRTKVSHRFCTWNIKAPNKNGRLSLQFKDFHVKSNGNECVDSIEVRQSKYNAPYIRYCDANYTSSVVIQDDTMIVRFRAPGKSDSRFRAVVKWTPDSDMCYNVKDNGWSYDGKVNYTDKYQSCLPWSQALTCVNSTLPDSYFLTGLEDNYCRNTDGSERPWCYNEDCEKQYCDVCQIEGLRDQSRDCQRLKIEGRCHTDPSMATKCAYSCKSVFTPTVTKVSKVSCPRPGQVSRGILTGSVKTSYEVGQTVSYKCSHNDRFVIRTCLSSGTWSVANTACLECPYGFIPFKDKCYKYRNVYTDKDGAINDCKKWGAVIATPKTEEQNDFISHLRGTERIWLGGNKGATQFLWNDGTPFKWTKWWWAKKKFINRDRCTVLEKSKEWTDDWCRDKLFHFVCQADRHVEQVECRDYLDVCPSLVQGVPGSDCVPYPALQVYCRSSCQICAQDCNQDLRMTDTTHSHDISSSSNHPLCSWSFSADNKNGKYIVSFDRFNADSSSSLEIKIKPYGSPIHIYNETNYQEKTYVFGPELFITFQNSGSSRSNFKANVRYIKDSDMCYNVKDKGWSYNGKVSYTKDFQHCISWNQTMHCVHNPLKIGDYMDNLDKNYCRNPDNSDQPWCYINKDCQRQYCDVCYIERPKDIANDCDQRKRKGLCNKSSIDCALTCQVAGGVTIDSITSVSDIKCGRPGHISGGTSPVPHKTQYNVGDKVVYNCTRTSFPVERVCLSSGEWSAASTACLECPLSFTRFRGNCYKFIDLELEYQEAEKECTKYDARLIRPKNKEDNEFIRSYSFGQTRKITPSIWLGVQKNEKGGNFMWNDNTEVTWTNWVIREPFKDRENCLTMRKKGKWNDDWCYKNNNFVCQLKADDKPDCKDFLDNCPDLLSLTGTNTCDDHTRLQTLCHYTCGLCPRDCDHNIELSESYPSYTISQDRKRESHRFCSWNFKGKGGSGRFVIQFESFDVGTPGKSCVDSIEIMQSEYDSTHKRYCNGNPVSFQEVLNDEVIVRFKTPGPSRSYFQARVQWVRDSDMCYNVADKGWSYNGHVNYTLHLQSCMPWSEVLNCPHNPLNEKNFQDNLEGNYCRNPDDSERPWCYTSKYCHRHDCDVCHLAKTLDTVNYCGTFKARGFCTSDPAGAFRECPATCQVVPSVQAPSVSNVECASPGLVPGGVMVDKQKLIYKVGDKVSFKCSRSLSLVQKTCLTSGHWSEAKTACLDCPLGWIHVHDKCYRFVEQFLEYDDAVYECKQLGGIVAPAKTKEINTFLHKNRPIYDAMWIGVKKSEITKKYVWTDGDPMKWTYFAEDKAVARREDCILMLEDSLWRDDWCTKKYYSFYCEIDSDDNPDCKDFTDTCPQLIQLKKDNKCDAALKKFCRKSCGTCTVGVK